ncbi:MAG: type II toxin-antitoxin system death-on-curing family toxin [Acidimicrobiaceae bacterium]|nr:type II toxin-antitoxin system death-on-curing family toxin [Acidimicrobiaceae bacterium]MXY09864.1 type II toxin-antitoxin system death-on-curing family toxin [Acidimicrobiaceae bacterium]MXZ65743.1 type II toxin-antitoxin system death-on-curing family toxin [Acidimicrobiaceae bacterium]MYF32462.1 type II toxin-antitoxin system death-on-curing family toxin [Acidimicrobiaceae bacterium]MYG77207.1 type II toxin-antitoxin system death-on-curing family toxin [Acidimicrobiaceae bacterium]
MTESLEYLEPDDLIDLAGRLLGDPPPIRDAGLLAAAAARPQASAFGTDAYPDIWTKASALLQSIVGNHPLIDGNKRLGWLATAVFLELNGVGITTAPNDDVYRLVMRVASESPEVEEIARWLRSLV